MVDAEVDLVVLVRGDALRESVLLVEVADMAGVVVGQLGSVRRRSRRARRPPRGVGEHTSMKSNLSKKLVESYESATENFLARASPAKARAAVPTTRREATIVRARKE